MRTHRPERVADPESHGRVRVPEHDDQHRRRPAHHGGPSITTPQDHADGLRGLPPHSVISLPVLQHVDKRADDLVVVQPRELVGGGLLDGRVRMVEKLDQEPARVRQAIREARSHAEFVVVLAHWGREHSRVPRDLDQQLAQQWLEDGAGLVVGTGPHVVQPIEHRDTGSIAWSLGNLVFDGPGTDPDWHRGAVLEVLLDTQTLAFVRMRLVPVAIANNGEASWAR